MMNPPVLSKQNPPFGCTEDERRRNQAETAEFHRAYPRRDRVIDKKAGILACAPDARLHAFPDVGRWQLWLGWHLQWRDRAGLEPASLLTPFSQGTFLRVWYVLVFLCHYTEVCEKKKGCLCATQLRHYSE